VLGAILGLLATVSIDSHFWQQFPLWPELSGLIFNVGEGKASDWGTSPWYYYMIVAVPKLLMNPLTWLLCIPVATLMPATQRYATDILIPLVGFIGIFSIQPHKEWRFIIYTVPGLTAVASLGANYMWTRRSKSIVYRFLSLALVASTIASFAASAGLLAISSLNYPGADALNKLHSIADGSQDIVSVHLDTYTCSTGVTRFLQKDFEPIDLTKVTTAEAAAEIESYKTIWNYDKEEDTTKLLDPAFWQTFDYVLAERPEKIIGKWEVVDSVYGFSGIRLVGPGDYEETSGEKVLPLRVPGANTISYYIESTMKEKITRGWWIGVRMAPKIKILKRID
jgi:alpha-1,6-mannosyltransferase